MSEQGKLFNIVQVIYVKSNGGVNQKNYYPPEGHDNIMAIMESYQSFIANHDEEVVRVKLIDGEMGSMMLDLHVDQEEILTKRLNEVKDVLKLAGQDGNWNFDSYNNGLFNGIELARTIMEGGEPQYRQLHKAKFMEDKDGKEKRNNIELLPNKNLEE